MTTASHDRGSTCPPDSATRTSALRAQSAANKLRTTQSAAAIASVRDNLYVEIYEAATAKMESHVETRTRTRLALDIYELHFRLGYEPWGESEWAKVMGRDPTEVTGAGSARNRSWERFKRDLESVGWACEKVTEWSDSESKLFWARKLRLRRTVVFAATCYLDKRAARDAFLRWGLKRDLLFQPAGNRSPRPRAIILTSPGVVERVPPPSAPTPGGTS